MAKRSLIPWAFQIPSMSLGAIFVHFCPSGISSQSHRSFTRLNLLHGKSPKRMGKFDSEIPVFKGSHDLLGGGFKYFLFSPFFWGRFPS